jgi:hypothetical protein
MTAAVLSVLSGLLAIVGAVAGIAGLLLDQRRRRRARAERDRLSVRDEALVFDRFPRPLPRFSSMTVFPSWSPADVVLMTRVADQWAECGLSTDPADRAAAEAGIRDLYTSRQLTPPTNIIWADSPRAAAGIVMALHAAADDRALTRAQILPDEERKTYREAHMALWAVMTMTRLPQLPDHVREVGRHVLAASLPDNFTERSSLLGLGRDGDLPLVPGQFDAATLAHYEMLDGYVRANPDVAAMHAVMEIARSAGPWWPFANTVVISERPTAIHLDDQQRLHHPTGPAVTYPDGWGVHAWHGVRVPANLIEGEPWTAERILTEPNTEIRRSAIERIGWDRFIDDAGLRPLGEPVPDPGNSGQLLALYEPPGGLYRGRVRVLLCTNGSIERDGTRRRFGLTVPGRFNDPVAAAAWTFGWTFDQYAALEHRR